MKKTIITAALGLFLGYFISEAQNVSDIIISEVLTDNETGIVDDYGRRTGWIELYNASQGTVRFGGCYLTNDRKDLRKFLIPKGISATSLAPGEVVLFHAGDKTEDGYFYTNFTIENGQTVYFVSNDGQTIVDSLTVPADLPADMSVAKYATDAHQKQFTIATGEPSPNAKNGNFSQESGAERIKDTDPHGGILTITSICVVFCALMILWLIFAGLGKWHRRDRYAGGNAVPTGKAGRGGGMSPEVAAAISMAIEKELGGELHAAIAMALDMHLNSYVHDNESYVITIDRSKRNGRWAEKGQTFRELPRK